MIVSLKDATKLVAISIMLACGVFVSTLFINYNIDIVQLKDSIVNEQMRAFYDAQVNTAVVVSAVSGGCLSLTSIVMLIFYVKNYVDTHKKELGILKAIGYSNIRIAADFSAFGLSALFGCLIGYIGAHIMMPEFYKAQNKDDIIPDVIYHFNPIIIVLLIIIPTVFFSLLAIIYANHSLKRTTIDLLKDNVQSTKKVKRYKEKDNNKSFLKELRSVTLKKKILSFFIIFAAFCFSAMTQMCANVDKFASPLMGWMMLIIGVLLAVTTLLLAIITVINGNKKNIAMMKVFGYSEKDCTNSILNIYRPLSYVGFSIGTFYQYFLLKIMVEMVFKDLVDVPELKFNFKAMFISLGCFIVFYELIMYVYSRKIRKISIKEIMLES